MRTAEEQPPTPPGGSLVQMGMPHFALPTCIPVPPGPAGPPASVPHRRHPCPRCACDARCSPVSTAAGCAAACRSRAHASVPQFPGPYGGGSVSECAHPDSHAPATSKCIAARRACDCSPWPGRPADGGASSRGACPCAFVHPLAGDHGCWEGAFCDLGPQALGVRNTCGSWGVLLFFYLPKLHTPCANLQQDGEEGVL